MGYMWLFSHDFPLTDKLDSNDQRAAPPLICPAGTASHMFTALSFEG